MLKHKLVKKIFLKGGEERLKRIIALVITAGLVSFAFAPVANSATTTGNIPVVANIQPGTPDMSFEIHKMNDGNPDNDPWTNYTTASNLTFDKWAIVQRPGKSAQWSSITMNTVIVWATGNGDDYQIYSDGTGALTGPGGTLPSASMICDPIYASQDKWWIDMDGDGVKDPNEFFEQGPQPSGSNLYAKGAALTVGKLIYSSESPVGSARILQILYAFPPYNLDGSAPYTGYVPIPSTMAAGQYTGANITIRIVSQ